jgi:nucleotide-binding universal stress UspA family protein
MNQTLIHTDGRVLAAIDPSVYAESVATLAAWAAQRMGSELELMHAIDLVADRVATPECRDLSGNLSLGTQESLMSELAQADEQRAKLAQAHGRMLLQQLQTDVAADRGVTALIRQRHGALVDTLLDLEDQVRLFVIGKRGEHADFAKGHLGSNLERVARAVHRPVLVASRAFRPVDRFMIAFDGSATTRTCVEMVAASPLLRGLACHLLMVGAERSEHRESLEWAAERLTQAGFEPQIQIVAGAPETVIAQQVEQSSIDLLVMGAYGHSRIRTMILGSTTTQLLRNCQIPVLLLR